MIFGISPAPFRIFMNVFIKHLRRTRFTSFFQ